MASRRGGAADAPDASAIPELELGPWAAPRVVPAAGHAWVEGDGGPYLVERESGGALGVTPPGTRTTRLPRERPVHRALWRVYEAHREAEPGDALRSDVLRLADLYGQIKLRRPERVRLPGSRPHHPRYGEPLAWWAAAIGGVGRLVALLDLLRHRSPGAGLVRHLVPVPKPVPDELIWDWRDGWPKPRRRIAWRRIGYEATILHWFERRDFARIGAAVFMQGLNDPNKAAVSPTLAEARAAGPDGSGEGGPLFVGRLIPLDLEKLAFVQLYQDAIGTLRVRECAACGEWFDVTPGSGKRGDAHYCGDTCRKRFVRRARRTDQGMTTGRATGAVWQSV